MPDDNTESPDLPLEEPFPPEPLTLLPGWPGYRIQPGRSGLGYTETMYEMAHMAGIFIRQFFTGAWLHPNHGPHPLIFLLVGIALFVAFPGGQGICLGVPAVLLIGLVMAFWNKVSSQGVQDKEEIDESEDVAEWIEEDDIRDEHDR